ncbi:hypothetical protein ACHAXS_011681 [Conticribra weissflogii]
MNDPNCFDDPRSASFVAHAPPSPPPSRVALAIRRRRASVDAAIGGTGAHHPDLSKLSIGVFHGGESHRSGHCLTRRASFDHGSTPQLPFPARLQSQNSSVSDDSEVDDTLATVADFHDVFQEMKALYPHLSMGALRQKTTAKVNEIKAEKEKEERIRAEEEKKNKLANSALNKFVERIRIRGHSSEIDDEEDPGGLQRQPQDSPTSLDDSDHISLSSNEDKRRNSFLSANNPPPGRKNLLMHRRKTEIGEAPTLPPNFFRRTTIDRSGTNDQQHPRNEILRFIKNKHNRMNSSADAQDAQATNFAPKKSDACILAVRESDLFTDDSEKSDDKSVASNYSVLSSMFMGDLIERDEGSDEEDKESMSKTKSLLMGILNQCNDIDNESENDGPSNEKIASSNQTTCTEDSSTYPNVKDMLSSRSYTSVNGMNVSSRSIRSEYSGASEFSADSTGLLVGFAEMSSGLIVGFQAQAKRLERLRNSPSQRDVVRGKGDDEDFSACPGGFAADFSAWEKNCE